MDVAVPILKLSHLPFYSPFFGTPCTDRNKKYIALFTLLRKYNSINFTSSNNQVAFFSFFSFFFLFFPFFPFFLLLFSSVTSSQNKIQYINIQHSRRTETIIGEIQLYRLYMYDKTHSLFMKVYIGVLDPTCIQCANK